MSGSGGGEVYGAAYYASHCGAVPYARNGHWLGVFGGVADQVVRAFAPGRVFDAGCALGMLVESLWDRGVQAWGRDISAYAISQVRPDVRGFCAVGSIAEPIEGVFDLVTCIEVLEHLPAEVAVRAVEVMAAAAPRVLFSSSPIDFDEPTHINVRPTLYWLGLWAEAGFAPSVTHDAGYLAPHAFVLERGEAGRSARELVAFADRIRHRVAMAQQGAELGRVRAALGLAEQQAAEALGRVAELAAARDAAVAAAGEASRAGEAARAAVEGELAEVRRALGQAGAESAMGSGLWRAMAPVRHGVGLVPGPVRGGVRRGVRLVGAVVQGRLGEVLRGARERQRDARAVAACGLFDAAWYRAANPDVAVAGVDPALHYASGGEAEGRDPGPGFSVGRYAAAHPEVRGELLLLHAVRTGQEADGGAVLALAGPERAEEAGASEARAVEAGAGEAGAVEAGAAEAVTGEGPSPPAVPDAAALLGERWRELRALPVFAAPDAGRRLTVVTDSVSPGSLYGGVGTALVLAALAAARAGAGLRLVTRIEAPAADDVGAVLTLHEVGWEGNIELVHAPWSGGDGRDAGVPMGAGDRVLTTSWWTTASALRSVARERVAYLLQEDERMFYPHGDDHLRAWETMREPGVLYLVNSEVLLGHLQAEGLAPGAVAFEPAFPKATYRRRAGLERRRQFFFYARPLNARNLYWRGLEAVAAAIEEGVLRADEWDLWFAGKGAPDLVLPGGVRPRLLENLPWGQYAALVGRMDLGLSLMYTPHPSYPPLDLAASGAVVVTNRFGAKESLAGYSGNILCSALDVPSLVEALRQGVALAGDETAREDRAAASGLGREWQVTAGPAVERLAGWMGG